MSKNIVSIHAYDCMDEVTYSARVRQYPNYEEGDGEVVLIHVGSFPSEGLTEPREWLSEILIAMLERL